MVTRAVTDLQDGQTVIVDTESFFGSEKLYRFHVGEVNNTDLTISLTAYSDYSDPDMFVDVGLEPTSTTFVYSSLVWGSGSIVIPPSEVFKDSDYYILVICYTFCRYGLTVSYSEEIVLKESIPISGSLTTGKQAIYEFVTSASPGEKLSITVKQLSGRAEIYASAGDEEPGSDNSLEIRNTWDGGYEFRVVNPLKNTIYRLAVMAQEDISFTVMASNSDTEAAMIQASVPVTGEVNTGEFKYYYIDINSPDSTISISLTMFSGDGDIYVKAGASPSLRNFDFSSVHMGNENLVISANERKNIRNPTGKYYIGIYGQLHAAFTLLVSSNNASFSVLQPGVPQSGMVNATSIKYYYLDFPANDTNITFSLSVGSGDPDLYVKACTSNLSNCYFADEEIYNLTGVWSSIHSSGSESIDIAHFKSSCPRKQSCSYIVGVRGIATYSTYTVLATIGNSNEIVLRTGRPQSITMPEAGLKYFKFSVINATVTEVLFMLTPIYGDTDIYTAFNVPVAYDSYDKSSINTGVEVDQVKYIRGVDSDTLVGTYHIMVHAIEPASFSIVVKETIPGYNTTIQLYPGHPQKDTIYNMTNMDYRIFFFPIHYTEETKQPITITLTAITGSYKIYVANQLSNLDWKNEIFYYN